MAIFSRGAFGVGEEVSQPARLFVGAPHPDLLPSRSRMFPTPANLNDEVGQARLRLRGEGVYRVRRSADPQQLQRIPACNHLLLFGVQPSDGERLRQARRDVLLDRNRPIGAGEDVVRAEQFDHA